MEMSEQINQAIRNDLPIRNLMMLLLQIGGNFHVAFPQLPSITDIEAKATDLNLVDGLVQIQLFDKNNAIPADAASMPVLVKAGLREVLVLFDTTLHIPSSKDSDQCYIDLPTEYRIKQRRKAYRVMVEGCEMIIQQGTEELKGDLETLNVAGDVKDISVLGLCARYEGNLSSIALGDVLNGCKVTLSDGAIIECEIVIRRVAYSEQENATMIAGEFTNMSYRYEATLGKFVYEQQFKVLQRFVRNSEEDSE